nr:hypothetical protein [uncultured Trichococcus sp.]
MDYKKQLMQPFYDFPEYNDLTKDYLWPVEVKYYDKSTIEFHLPKSDIIEAMYSIEQRLEDESNEPFKIGDRFIAKENLNYISFEGRTYAFAKE